MAQTIGQLFTKSYDLDLLPGIKLPHGFYELNIRYVTSVNEQVSIHHMSCNLSWHKKAFIYKVGCDIREIFFEIKSLSYKNPICYKYNIRIDHLLLLNLALKVI